MFESPRRVADALRAIAEAFGPERPVALARELTKLHEEVLRGTVEEVLARLGIDELRGEVVLVVGGVAEGPAPELSSLLAEAEELVRAGSKKRRAAVEVAKRHDVSANAIYRAMLERP